MNPNEIERTKLLANALDRASPACIAVGVFAPIANLMYGTTAPTQSGPFSIYLGVLSWLISAIILHVIAHQILRRLK